MHDGGNHKGEGNRICSLSERWRNIFLAEMAIDDRGETVKHEHHSEIKHRSLPNTFAGADKYEHDSGWREAPVFEA